MIYRVLILVLLPVCFYGQQNYVSGKILDSSSNKPLVYVNIFIKGQNRGTVSEARGSFFLSYSTPKETDTLIISYIGYNTLKMGLDNVSKENQKFYLVPKTCQLSTTEIVYLLPKNLIKMAVENIPRKFCVENTLAMAIYSETICQYSFGDSATRNVIAAIGIPYLSYNKDNKKSTENILLYGIKKSDDSLKHYKNRFARTPILTWTLEENMLEFNKGRNPVNGSNSYVYKYSDTLFTIDNERIIKIDFTPKKLPSILMQGSIYINMADTVITRIESQRTLQNCIGMKSMLEEKFEKPIVTKMAPKKVTLEYRKTKDGYNLSYIDFFFQDGDYFENGSSPYYDYYSSKIIVIGDDVSHPMKYSPVLIDKSTDLYYQTPRNDKDFWERFNLNREQLIF